MKKQFLSLVLFAGSMLSPFVGNSGIDSSNYVVMSELDKIDLKGDIPPNRRKSGNNYGWRQIEINTSTTIERVRC